MLLRLRKTESSAELASLHGVAEELGYRIDFLGADRRVLELVRPDGSPGRPNDRSRFEDLACVQAVLDASDAPELAERAGARGDTVVAIRDARIGDGELALIAGPCAVEDEADLLDIARRVAAAGAEVLRGGAFKPRTSPYSFQGLGREGLARLAAAREETGLAIVTEVLDPRDVEAVISVADALQLGSRSMSNAALLTEAGRTGLPVLLKRGLAATVREFLLAAEYVLATGNPNVVLCERGIRGFDSVTRNVLDVGAIAHLQRATHLPILVDPSHAAGRADLVAPLALAGVAAGADGILVEVHPRPERAHSDAAQAISPEAFADVARRARELFRVVRSGAAPDCAQGDTLPRAERRDAERGDDSGPIRGATTPAPRTPRRAEGSTP